MKPLILISAEDVDFYLLLDHVMEAEGFATALAGDLEETLQLAGERRPQVIVLDCRPGSFAAVEACDHLKQGAATGSIPVIALVRPGAERDHVELLKAGVDDTFTRPVLPAKLVGCIRGLLNGAHAETAGSSNGDKGRLLTYADIEMSLDSYRVRRNGRDIHLGPTEFRLLRHLMQNPGQVFTRDELIGAAWQENVYVEPRTVDVHIGRLRKTLKSSSDKDIIRTVRSAGYALTDRLDEGVVSED